MFLVSRGTLSATKRSAFGVEIPEGSTPLAVRNHLKSDKNLDILGQTKVNGKEVIVAHCGGYHPKTRQMQAETVGNLGQHTVYTVAEISAVLEIPAFGAPNPPAKSK